MKKILRFKRNIKIPEYTINMEETKVKEYSEEDKQIFEEFKNSP